jgi:hypothetical protein
VTLRDELDGVADATLAALRSADHLTPATARPEHASHVGAMGDAALTWTTETWHGRDALELVRIARVDGDAMSSITVLAYPRPERGAAILGADLVGFGGRLTFVAFDLVPTARPLAAGAGALLERARAQLDGTGTARPAEGPFSQAAALRAIDRGADPSLVAGAYLRYLDGFLAELARPPSTKVSDGLQARARWARTMAEHMRAVAPLRKLFGGDWIDRYFATFFLAPSSTAALPSTTHHQEAS